MTILSRLDGVSSLDRPLVGEKAFVLSQLKQREYPIADGFTIINTAFQQFFENINDSASMLADFPHSSLYLDIDDSKALQVVARESRRVIRESSLPGEWLAELTEAVGKLRSDALIWRFSLPGTIARRSTGLLTAPVSRADPESIENALKTAWAELFTAKSLFYWRRMGIGLETVRLAILVQPLVNAVCSGRVTVETDRLRIEATWGLDRSLRDGEVAPDIYTVHRGNYKLLDRRLGMKSRAYSLALSGDPVTARSPDLEEQETYCLDNETLDRILEITGSLIAEKPSLTGWHWSIDADSRLYLLNCHHEETVSSPLSSPRFPLKGLAASPGIVSGVVRVVTDLDQIRENLENSILVTPSLPPHQLSHLRSLRGIITEHGGITSHGAILARELGIPAVVGVPHATSALRSGETILLDGTTGLVSKGDRPLETVDPAVRPPLDPTPTGTRLMVNISQIESIERVLTLPVDGIGLLRSEWMLGDAFSRRSLQEWMELERREEFIGEIARLIGHFATRFAPRPVFYRSFDNSMENDGEDRRGTLAYTLDPTFFELELQALRRVQTGATNVNLILPFVRSIEEFIFCRERVRSAGLAGVPSFQLWIMAEVPSVIFQLQDYVRAGVQGIAIGTNDLARWLLGIDRDRPPRSEQLTNRHPALLAALKQTLQQARRLNIPCSVCGVSIVENPDSIDDLVKWGVTSLSVDPDSVLSTREAIVRSERRLLLETARESSFD